MKPCDNYLSFDPTFYGEPSTSCSFCENYIPPERISRVRLIWKKASHCLNYHETQRMGNSIIIEVKRKISGNLYFFKT